MEVRLRSIGSIAGTEMIGAIGTIGIVVDLVLGEDGNEEDLGLVDEDVEVEGVVRG